MEKFIKSIYTESILHEAIFRYGFEKKSIIDINGFQSFVYECRKNGESYILRITHSSHRSDNMIKAELHWIHYLTENGIYACRPILSESNRFVEIIELEDSYFAAVAFEKAKGKYIPACEWKPVLIQELGRITGKMHTLSKGYNPPSDLIKRQEWFEVDNYNIDKYLQNSQIEVKNRLHKLVKKISTFPKDKDSFGLIHADLRAENLSFNQKESTIFDFDGCIYSWFIHDIAIILFTAIRFGYGIENDKSFAHNFMKNFWKGYSRENTISQIWWSRFIDFLQLEEIGEYILIHRSCDLKNLDSLSQRFMNNRKYKIEHNMHYIDFNINGDFYR